ncbi:MAG: aldehyde dehydrogenase family protein [Chitinivibrionales bacterium]|nr:aldehyde dehydrogenase family protein [Chitinivibrionales bacterium]MBD3357922.1 aldehyde dehydrogenase family protein [Chitinivibrionales bacterium]
MDNISSLVNSRRDFFRRGETGRLSYRLCALKRLRDVLLRNERRILEAVGCDMGKPSLEALASEWAVVVAEVKYALRHLRSWARRSRRPTSFLSAPASSFVEPVPYGVVLIIAPWNYPLHLSLLPLIGAVAAGNCAIVKPSEYAPASSALLASLVRQAFREEHVAVVEGDVECAKALLARRFDYIFFTGSIATGRKVMEAAVKWLTPTTLELGGKNPCIVEPDADPKLAARRIAWGKFFNAGQTCVAPDYLLVHRSIKKPFIREMQSAVDSFYGDDPSKSRDYARIINRRHFERLRRLLSSGTVIIGGDYDNEALYMAPTVLDDVTWEAPAMREEIFGPILPVLGYDDIGTAIEIIETNASDPLALYLFSRDQKVWERVTNAVAFGGGCFNDIMSHIIGPHLPFGGVGTSGMGSYHGKESFLTFSRKRSVMHKSTAFDMPFRYPPYNTLKKTVVRLLTKWL